MRSENYYYTKDSLSDDLATVDIGASATRGVTSRTSAHITPLKKNNKRQVMVISLILCNSVLTVVSLVIALVSIYMVTQQGTQQAALSTQVSDVKAEVDKDYYSLGNFTRTLQV